ncbi:hypothetical protein BG015_003950 [Linnemannia schmuckeri]|uniref:Oligopeptide transporter n=1 Tax=Linnemannia schmuckeri TaxID=64567 RepID=A0A9P5S2V2_9FUNG|nr:hypothetical protein BG015_003950 [Linnemannia schmuckeri]
MEKEEVIHEKYENEKQYDDVEPQVNLEEDDDSPIEEFFYLRQTQISIGYSVVALLSLPMGHFLARVLPTHQFNLFGFKFSLNPSPFNIKEHVLIGTMVACNQGTAYAVDIVILQKLWYNSEKSFVADMFLVLTTQITGFAIAVTASLFRSLHAQRDEDDNGRMSRMRYFMIIAGDSFVYYWIPCLIFPTIGYLAWICWINPNNVVLSQLTSTSGLVTPWFAQVNILVGFILVAYIMVLWAYYSDLWGSKTFPIVTALLYRGNGSEYDKSLVLNAQGILDEQLYVDYDPLRMDSFFALTYGVGFAGLTATIIHVILNNGREIVERWKSARAENEDVHSRLMRVYPEVPDWWYGLLFIVTFGLSMVTCVVWDYMPWWALLLALGIAMFFVLPVGTVQAVTNQQPGLNIVTEYIIGYLLPSNAIANVTFKTYGYIVNVRALNFVSDLKLGHYMKIPSKIMFMAQLISAVISCIINLGTATWLINTRPNVCTPAGAPFTCRSTKTFYSASIIWGAIGPARVFGNKDDALYSPVQWCFLVSALLPLIFWALSKKFPNVGWLRLVHWPVLLAATSNMPPGLPYMYTNGLALGFIFAFWLRRYRYNWWSRYNYLTSAALDSGVAIAGLVIFFALQAWDISFPTWWGNPANGVLDHCPLGGANYAGDSW